jgi:pimeloyl-ACP methyl ester carboxylesterase
MPKKLTASLLALALLSVTQAGPPPAAAPATAPAAAALRLSPCQIEHPLQLALIAAECGTLSVAENPGAPGGRQIGLEVTRVAAISREKLPDPLFVLAGGPGQGAASFYAAVAPVFARILRERDIVLVDQRGTGGSNRLGCKLDEDFVARSKEADILAASRACLAELAPHADPAYYTTSLAVQDLERVRAALGYARINLYASSYGTRVAQQYLRHHGEHVRSLIMDGVVAPQSVLGSHSALDAEAALAGVLGRCASDRACSGVFGDPDKDYRAVRASLTNRPFYLTVPDPQTGLATPVAFGPEQLAIVLRLGTYSADFAALLPLLLSRAGSDFDFAPIAAQYLMTSRTYGEAIATGMHNTVVCAEDVPFFDPADLERTRRAAPYLGTTQIDGLKALCKVWPKGPVDADLHAPLTSDVPTLLLSGKNDPVTPPAGAALAARGLRHVRSIVMDDVGHGQLVVPCMDRVMAQFVALGSAEQVDDRCTRNPLPTLFFLSLNGPAP